MQTLRQNAIAPRLALIIAGRRVVQPLYTRTFRVSLRSRAELIPKVPHPPTPSLPESQSDVGKLPSPLREPRSPKPPKKGSNLSPPSPKPKAKKSSSVTRKKSQSTQIITRHSKRQKSVRKTKGVSSQVLDGSDFTPDSWSANWGKDGGSVYWTFEFYLFYCIELAPPLPTKRRTAPKLRPRKEVVPAVSDPSSSSRALPPHRIPYVRRTEGYISDEAGQCNNVLRGALRDFLTCKYNQSDACQRRRRISFRA